MNLDALETKQEISRAVSSLRSIVRSAEDTTELENLLLQIGKVAKSASEKRLELLCKVCSCESSQLHFQVGFEGKNKNCVVKCLSCGRNAWGSTEEFTARKWNEKL